MTGLALVHFADNPLWATAAPSSAPPGLPVPLRRAGFNLGAPGDRKAADGTLWLAVGAKTTNGVTVKGPSVEWFELHPSQTGNWKRWATSSPATTAPTTPAS